jgi:hypothetical protein
MELAAENGGVVTAKIARKVRRSVGQCHSVYKMLTNYATMGAVKVVYENGVKITRCPPGYAGGIYPQKSVGYGKIT